MKRFVFTVAAGLCFASSVFAAGVTPMNLVEKSSYRLTALVKKGAVPKAMATDLVSVAISDAPGGAGHQLVLSSLSADPSQLNTVSLVFGTDAKVQSEAVHFVSTSPHSPIFTQADGATLLDLAAEAVVDHLTEDAQLVQVAELAQLVSVSKVATASGDAAQFDIQMKDGRIYRVLLDLDGNLLSKGFAH